MKSIALATAALAILPFSNVRAADYAVDSVNSFITFNIEHFKVGRAFGRFNEFTGSVSYDPAKVSDSKVSFTIQAASIDTGNKKRDDHLRNKDFFDVVQFPEISFASSSVADGKVTGKLTMMGVTKEVTAEFNVAGIGEHPGKKKPLLGAIAKFVVKRSDFGMKYGLDAGALGDEVELTVSIEGLAE